MALSASFDASLNAREVVTFALHKLNVKGLGASLNALEAEAARIQLNLMLKSWQLHGPHLWATRNGMLAAPTLTALTRSFVLTDINPLRIISARFQSASGNEIPMEMLTRAEYDNLPNKDSRGTPTQYYFNPQRGVPRFYIWPLLSSVTTEQINLTVQARVNDIDDLANDIDVPQEWLETVGYNLAARLADDKGKDSRATDRIIARAEMLHQQAMDYEREDVVRFTAGEDY